MSFPLVVRAFLFNSEGQILLAKHKQNTPWVLPGGHVEKGESLHNGIIRELKEEFGVTAKFFEIDGNEQLHHQGKRLQHFPLPIAIYALSYKNSEGKDKSRIEHIFLMETNDLVKQVQTNEITEYQWFEADDIFIMKPNEDIYDFIIELLDKILGEDNE